MHTALIASFGFDERFVVRAIIRHGLSQGDLVILLTSKLVEKAEKAYKYVDQIARNVQAKVEVVELGESTYSFPHLVRSVKDILIKQAKERDRVTVILSGGMRIIVLGLYTAALSMPKDLKDKISIEIDTEDINRLVVIPRNIVEIINPPSLGAKSEILDLVIKTPGLTIDELANKLGKDRSTIRRHLQALKEMKLITLRGRPFRVWPQESAYIII